MELDEVAWKWLVAGGIAAAFMAHQILSALNERRRRRSVDALAQALGATATHAADHTSRFTVKIGDRPCEIAQGYNCRTSNGRYCRGYRLLVSIPLQGVSDIYDLFFEQEESLSVNIRGYAPRDGWPPAALREAIANFYDVASDREPLYLEAGTLLYATNRKFDGPALDELVKSQLVVATHIDRTL